MRSSFRVLLLRELKLGRRSQVSMATTLFFFAMIWVLVPFAVGNDAQLLRRLSGAIGWIALLLALFLPAQHAFDADREHGVLEQFLLLSVPPSWLMMVKIIGVWLMHALPLACVIGLAYGMQTDEWPLAVLLSLTLLVAALAIISVIIMMNALTLGARAVGTLLPVLVIPFCLPVVIFGAGCTLQAEQLGLYAAPVLQACIMLGSVVLLLVPVSIIAGAASLKQAVAE